MLCFRVIGAVLGVAAALAFNLHEAIVVINPRWDVCLGLAVLLMPKVSALSVAPMLCAPRGATLHASIGFHNILKGILLALAVPGLSHTQGPHV